MAIFSAIRSKQYCKLQLWICPYWQSWIRAHDFVCDSGKYISKAKINITRTLFPHKNSVVLSFYLCRNPTEKLRKNFHSLSFKINNGKILIFSRKNIYFPKTFTMEVLKIVVPFSKKFKISIYFSLRSL